MTKKDYKLIARVIAKYPNNAIIIPKSRLIQDLCQEFERDNPDFDPDKFRKTCRWVEAERR